MTSTVGQLRYSSLPKQRVQRGWIIRGMKWLAAMAFWVLLAAIIVGGTTYAVASEIGLLLAVFAPIGLILLLVAGAILARGSRRVRDLAVLHYLEQAVHANAPLAGILAAAERSERAPVRLRLRRLRIHLQAGEPVAAALSIAAPALPARMIGLIAAGENTGCLSAALRRVTGRRDFLPAGDPALSIVQRWYPPVIFVLCFLVVQAIMIFISPKLGDILDDFHLPVPASLAALRQIPWVLELPGFSILACVVLATSIFCGRILSQVFTSRGVTLGPLRRFADAVVWYTPVAAGLARSRAMADVCFTLAGALDAGQPPSQAIVESSVAAGNWIVQCRVRRWGREMLAGRSITDASRIARLPALLGQMLAAGTPGDLPETFRFLCGYYDTRFSRAATLLRGALLPATAIGVGILVLIVALSVFQPLTELINKLSAP